MMPNETIVLTTQPADQKCANCRHSIPSPIGARVLCFLRGEQMPLADSCCRWQTRDE